MNTQQTASSKKAPNKKATKQKEVVVADEKKLTQRQFVKRAIKNLRAPGQMGIHVVWSGFNKAFEEYFPGQDPVKCTSMLKAEGFVTMAPTKGGYFMNLASDVAHAGKNKKKPSKVLKKILA